jgi:hypothetical protein
VQAGQQVITMRGNNLVEMVITLYFLQSLPQVVAVVVMFLELVVMVVLAVAVMRQMVVELERLIKVLMEQQAAVVALAKQAEQIAQEKVAMALLLQFQVHL